ncbi:MAG: FecCD family ABC transporter permease [Anaerovoracaceae bacterium]
MSDSQNDGGKIRMKPASSDGGSGRITPRPAAKKKKDKNEKKAVKAARAKDRERQKRDSGRITMRTSASSADVEALKAQKARTRKFKRGNKAMVVLGVALVLVFMFSTAFFVTVSEEHMYLAYWLELSRTQAMRFFNFITGAGAEGGIQFVTYRNIMVVMAGACLACSGAIYQGTFRNILASPSTLGVMSGGSLGNIIYALFFVSITAGTVKSSDLAAEFQSQNLLMRNLQSFMVLAGCFGAVALVVVITLLIGRGKFKSNYLILTGIIFSSLIGTFSSMVQYYLIENNPNDPRIDVIRNLTMGGFVNSYKLDQVLIMAALLIPCCVILMAMSGRLDALSLGDEQARTMGINVRLCKILAIAVNTIMTAVIIAFCGQIGFIGFIIPLAARRIVGPGFRKLIPASMLLGSVVLLIIYDIAILTHMTGYLNVLTSGIGSVVMIIAYIKGGGAARGDYE